MIEPPKQVGKILSGAKTQITRPRRAGHHCRWQAGHSYGIRTANDKPEVTRVKVTAVREAELHEFTDADARAEGFADVDELFREFYERYGQGPGYDRAHPNWPFAIVPVWVIGVELDVEAPPRLLARHSERGYVTNPADALPDEGEAVPEAFQAQLSAESQGNFAKLRAEERDQEETRRIVARLRRAKAQARAAGVDVTQHVREIEKQLKAIEEDLARGT